MPSSRPFLVDPPAREGPEASPLTSHASCFLTVPSADRQTRNSLKVSQPCGLRNDLVRSKPAVAWRTVKRAALALPTESGGLRDFTSSLHYPVVAG